MFERGEEQYEIRAEININYKQANKEINHQWVGKKNERETNKLNKTSHQYKQITKKIKHNLLDSRLSYTGR